MLKLKLPVPETAHLHPLGRFPACQAISCRAASSSALSWLISHRPPGEVSLGQLLMEQEISSFVVALKTALFK